MHKCNEIIHFIHLRFEEEEEGSELRKSMPRSKGTKNRKTRAKGGGERRENIHEKVKYYRLNGDDGAHALTDKICVSPLLREKGKCRLPPRLGFSYDHAVLARGARGEAEEHQETGAETRTAVQRPHDTHSLSPFSELILGCVTKQQLAPPPSPHSVLF